MSADSAGQDDGLVRDILTRSTAFLERHKSPSPRLDAEVLMAHAMGLRRLDLYLSPERPLKPAELDLARKLVQRRGQGEPVAYLVGTREFHGLTFKVTPAVLIPRPETEAIVDAALEWLGREGGAAPLVVDVGTGSGAIACAVAVGSPAARVMATDLSAEALIVARQNVESLGLNNRITLFEGDLLDPVPADLTFDLVVSNPPYVAMDGDDGLAPDVARWEPSLALDGGPDGMVVTTRLIAAARDRLRSGGMLLFEVGSVAQRERAEALLRVADGFCEVRPCLDVAKVVRGFQVIRT